MPSETVRWISLCVGAVIALIAAAFLLWRIFRRRPSPDELERRRRNEILKTGKIRDGEITDVEGSIIMYTYSVSGVVYSVAQDATAIARLLPDDRMRMVGPASVRYDAKNPFNSIVICEAWSGLRLHLGK